MALLIILLTFVAIACYCIGSINTVILASDRIFGRDLYRYPLNNRGITAFLMDNEWWEIAHFVLLCVLRTAIPVLLSGWLLSIYDISVTGRAFALLALMLGVKYPISYRMQGLPTAVCFAVGSLCVNTGLGVAVLGVFFGVYFITRYIGLSAMLAAVSAWLLSIVAIDVKPVHWIYFACALLVLWEYRRSIVRLINKKEKKFVFKRDLSYMFTGKRPPRKLTKGKNNKRKPGYKL